MEGTTYMYGVVKEELYQEKKKKYCMISVNREMYTVLWEFRVKPGDLRQFLRRGDT